MTIDSLERVQLTIHESQSWIEKFSMELRQALSSPATDIVQSSIVAVGDDLLSTNYCCEQVEDGLHLPELQVWLIQKG